MSAPITGLLKIAEDIYATHLAPLHAQIEALTAQRDALKTAAEQWIYVWEETECEHDDVMPAVDLTRAALALVKGGA